MNHLRSGIRLAWLAITIAILCVCAGSGLAGPTDAEAIARAVSKDVAEVGKCGKGDKGAPILILEENHASRAGEVEVAILLLRLHSQYGLKDIALEGYLKGRPAIDSSYWEKASRGDSAARPLLCPGAVPEGWGDQRRGVHEAELCRHLAVAYRNRCRALGQVDGGSGDSPSLLPSQDCDEISSPESCFRLAATEDGI